MPYFSKFFYRQAIAHYQLYKGSLASKLLVMGTVQMSKLDHKIDKHVKISFKGNQLGV